MSLMHGCLFTNSIFTSNCQWAACSNCFACSRAHPAANTNWFIMTCSLNAVSISYGTSHKVHTVWKTYRTHHTKLLFWKLVHYTLAWTTRAVSVVSVLYQHWWMTSGTRALLGKCRSGDESVNVIFFNCAENFQSSLNTIQNNIEKKYLGITIIFC